MAGKVALLTDWVKIGKSGPTIDGRRIEAAMIKEAAATYDPESYTAVLNYEHYFGNFGSVRELRVTPAPGGESFLEARLQPNASMLGLNQQGSKVFTSMELWPNFAGSGKWYLSGLALTDTPASLGTTELKFSKHAQDSRPERSESLELDPACFSVASGGSEDPGLIAKIASALAPLFASSPKKPQNPQESPAMTPEQFKALQDGQASVVAAITKLGETFAAKPPPAAAEPKAPEGKTEAPPAAGVTKEQFAALEKSNSDLAGALQKLTATVEAAMKGQPGTPVPPNEGSGNDDKFV
ncbi:MAG: hypothetical protein RL095_2168 [Verrucomicrobiota bacterium]|jgi:hypothetical protein